MMRYAWLVLLALVAGCSTSTAPRATPTATPTNVTCHYQGKGLFVLPDGACTSGALNPLVTPATVRATICKAGWTATQRPPAAYTEPLKRKQMVAYGQPLGKIGAYEEDHLVPLELGGAPRDARNLWPEPDYPNGPQPTKYDRNPKDQLEFVLRNKVCSTRHPMSLNEAQQDILDWVLSYQQMGLKP